MSLAFFGEDLGPGYIVLFAKAFGGISGFSEINKGNLSALEDIGFSYLADGGEEIKELLFGDVRRQVADANGALVVLFGDLIRIASGAVVAAAKLIIKNDISKPKTIPGDLLESVGGVFFTSVQRLLLLLRLFARLFLSSGLRALVSWLLLTRRVCRLGMLNSHNGSGRRSKFVLELFRIDRSQSSPSLGHGGARWNTFGWFSVRSRLGRSRRLSRLWGFLARLL